MGRGAARQDHGVAGLNHLMVSRGRPDGFNHKEVTRGRESVRILALTGKTA